MNFENLNACGADEGADQREHGLVERECDRDRRGRRHDRRPGRRRRDLRRRGRRSRSMITERKCGSMAEQASTRCCRRRRAVTAVNSPLRRGSIRRRRHRRLITNFQDVDAGAPVDRAALRGAPAGANTILGGAGGDTIDGGGGADVISAGGGGDNVVAYRGSEVSIDGGGGRQYARAASRGQHQSRQRGRPDARRRAIVTNFENVERRRPLITGVSVIGLGRRQRRSPAAAARTRSTAPAAPTSSTPAAATTPSLSRLRSLDRRRHRRQYADPRRQRRHLE